MAKTPYQIVTIRMYPTPRQEELLNELIASSDYTYAWVMQRLVDRVYRFDEAKLLDCVNHKIKPDWIENRPPGLCPMVMMAYLIREVCHNWLDCAKSCLAMHKQRREHKGKFYMPASGHTVRDSLWVSNVGNIKTDHVELSSRLYLITGYKKRGVWYADLRIAAKSDN